MMETFQTAVCLAVACYVGVRVAVFLTDAIYESLRPPGALRRRYDDD